MSPSFEQVRFGELVENFDSKRQPVRSSERIAGPYPYYGASGVVDYVNGFILDGEYLLVSEDGENLRSRSTPIAFLADGKFWPNNHVHVVRGREVFDSRYLAYALSRVDLTPYLSGSAQPKLNRSALDSIPIPVPAPAVRKAIAEVLGALDDKIAANTKLAATATELLELEASARWLSTNEDPIPITDLFDVNPTTARPADSEPLYLDMKKLPESSSGISSWEYREAKGGARFLQGDTLVARITPCLENRKTGFVDFLGEGQVGIGSTEFIVLRAKPGVPKPLSYVLAVDGGFRDFAIRHMVGTSGRQRVSGATIATYLLPRPAPRWLDDFGGRVTDTFAFLKSLRDENRTLAATRDALLPALMSGTLRVRDLNRAV